MYEKTLSVDMQNATMLQHIDTNVMHVVQRLGGVVARSSSGNRHYMALAVPDTYAKQMNDLIGKLVQDILTVTYKHNYLSDNLIVTNNNLVSNTLINCMSIFDNAQDKKSLDNDVLDNDILALDGYYNFRMRALRDKWQEVVSLVNSNSEVMYDNETMLQFIGYMVEGVTHTAKLSVSIDTDKYVLYDKKDSVIANTNIPIYNASVYELAMVDILLHNPRQLSLYVGHTNEQLEQLIWIATRLYDTKIYKNS